MNIGGSGVTVGPLPETARLRRARPGASAIDDVTYSTNAVHGERSATWARSLAPRYDLAAASFTEPELFDADLSALGEGFGRADLSRVVRTLEAFDSFVMMTGGESISHGPFLHQTHQLWRPSVINGNRVLAAIAAAHTPNFSGIDRSHPVLNEVCEHVERIFGCQSDASVFVSSGTKPSSGLHVDTGELLVIPLDGPKRWRVLRPAIDVPLSPSHEAPLEGEVVFDGVLEPGSALTIPRGWPHDVSPLGPVTMSLTISLYRPVRAAAVVANANRAIEMASLRAGFSPNDVDESVEAIEAACRSLFSSAAIEGEICQRRNAIPLRNHGDLAWGLLDGRLSPNWRVSCRAPGGATVATDRDDEPLGVAIGGRLVSFEPRLSTLVASVLSSHRSVVSDLVEDAEGLPAVQAIVDMIADGLLDVEIP